MVVELLGRGVVQVGLVEEKGNQFLSSDVSLFLLGPCDNLLGPLAVAVPCPALCTLLAHL